MDDGLGLSSAETGPALGTADCFVFARHREALERTGSGPCTLHQKRYFLPDKIPVRAQAGPNAVEGQSEETLARGLLSQPCRAAGAPVRRSLQHALVRTSESTAAI